jgi:hypothetical protein
LGIPAYLVTTAEGVILKINSPLVTYKFLLASMVIPKGAIKLAAVPVPSELAYSPLPANVVTVAIKFTLSALEAANVAEEKGKLVDSLLSPQAIATLDGLVSVNKDASHFTQEETVKGDEPIGSEEDNDDIDLDRYDSRERVRIFVGNDVALEYCKIPPVLF